ncbi:YjbH domain-containing protein [Vibrio diazotrophicus]|uniref:YjbH domain-containing protein n=1 Tax=Vibrio diazotrophicus TaxID=685 RepID=UPI000C9E1FD0|nr:YjbH domain-containing protein [Vibrio diazotrophicus]PNH80309.1 hypothetical protein C1N27_10100 [Vibrio diazotrophicus]
MKTLSSLSFLAQMTLLTAVSTSLSPAIADDFSYPAFKYSQTDFGGTGLMQMPSARMMPEGELRFGTNHSEDYIHYNASLQLFPWLETTIRYSQVSSLLYSGNESFSGDTKYTDKSIDAKIRFWQETYWLPEMSIGFQDFGGTGLFDGEYVVASKNLGAFDVTMGIGWGYLGNRANLNGENTTSTDCNRNTGYEGTGGSFDVNRMFTGCSAIFGGIEYQTPFAPLRLKLEYDGNDYRSDFPVTQANEPMTVSTPWNFGLVYALADWADLRLSYERGNTYFAGITLGTNLADLRPGWLDSSVPDYSPVDKKSDLTNEEWAKLTQDLSQVAGYSPVTVYHDSQSITVEGQQIKYRERSEAEQRAAVLLANSGLDVKEYRLIETKHQQPLTETHINSRHFKRVIENDYPNASIDDVVVSMNPKPIVGKAKAESWNRLQYGLSPSLQQSIGGSESFYLYAIGLSGNASYFASRHWLLSGSLYANVYNNYDKFKYTVPPDGTDLKRVRTLSRQYYEDVALIDNLQLTYLDKFGDNTYTQAYAGYLETMFAGVGSEILYRPLDKNWALGINGNYVKQRDPDSLLGLYNQERYLDSTTGRYYNVQTGTATGHVTLYWQPKFWPLFDNTLIKLSAGRYLTDDVGATVDFSKQFSSGVIAGAFATKTNLSSEEFGEGSFTKGFYISIPLDLMTVRPSQQRANITWMPIQRDGGQMLKRKYNLYTMTDARSPWLTKAIGE